MLIFQRRSSKDRGTGHTWRATRDVEQNIQPSHVVDAILGEVVVAGDVLEMRAVLVRTAHKEPTALARAVALLLELANVHE